MKGRFSPDLFVVVLGAIVVAVIVVGLGSLISHAQHLCGSVAIYAIVTPFRNRSPVFTTTPSGGLSLFR
jgi:hypothetical protein